LIFKKLIKIN